jgi:hypothetical protein
MATCIHNNPWASVNVSPILWSSDGLWVAEDVICKLQLWCRENIGPPGGMWYWDDHMCVFSFQDAQDCVAFKLAFKR